MKITRTEIAEKYGIAKVKLANIIIYQPRLKFPRPVGVKSNRKLYDQDAVEKFFAANPHENITYASPNQMAAMSNFSIDVNMAIQFIRGEFAHTSIQLDNAKRLIRARRRPEHSDKHRKTVRIRENMA